MEPDEDDEYAHWTYYVLGWSLHFCRWNILTLLKKLNGFGCNARIVLYVPYAQCLPTSPMLQLYAMRRHSDVTLIHIKYNKDTSRDYEITSNEDFRDYYYTCRAWAPIQFDGMITG